MQTEFAVRAKNGKEPPLFCHELTGRRVADKHGLLRERIESVLAEYGKQLPAGLRRRQRGFQNHILPSVQIALHSSPPFASSRFFRRTSMAAEILAASASRSSPVRSFRLASKLSSFKSA